VTATTVRSASATASRPAYATPTELAPTATATLGSATAVTETATLTVTMVTSPTLNLSPDGAVMLPAPYATFRRPFEPPLDDRPSRYYPFGTTAGGAYLLHHGVDIGNPQGTPVHAVGDGQVIYAGPDAERMWGPQTDFYGNVIVISHPQPTGAAPLYSLYGHLSRVLVTAGQPVQAGDVIGEVGATGIALGPHLHLEFRTPGQDYDSARNAELYLAPLSGHGTIVGRLLDSHGALAPDTPIGLYHSADDGSQQWIAGTTTYPAGKIGSTADWGENFVFGDIPVGQYRVVARGGRTLSADVTIRDGALVRATLQPEP
jgi:murein DD-endopeptidase MepM/ murein hydrolase activator NlpD